MIRPDENKDNVAGQAGYQIWRLLRATFPNDTDYDMDIILNTLCYGIVKLIKEHTNQQDHPRMIRLVNNILEKNILENKISILDKIKNKNSK